MLIKIYVATLFAVCLAHGAVVKPTEDELKDSQGGFFSTVWGWITYPFTWWSPGTAIEESSTDHLIAAATPPANSGNVEIGNRNVTVWCNDQICTTRKCDSVGCVNVTCNIYDTDLKGECREYSTIEPEQKPTEPTERVTESTKPPEVLAGNESHNKENKTEPPQVLAGNQSQHKENKTEAERPLELEVVMSSTVNQDGQKELKSEKAKNKTANLPNKVK